MDLVKGDVLCASW